MQGYALSNSSDSVGHNPGAVLPDGVPGGWKYIFQGWHTTTGGYRDTMDFAFSTLAAGGDDTPATTIRAFNVANIHGALGDHGQSYKSLMFMIRALASSNQWPAKNGPPAILHGCGKPIPL